MSNSIKIPSCELPIDPQHFDTSILQVCEDTDGNSIQVTETGISLFLAEHVTYRDLRAFLLNTLCKAIKLSEVRFDVPNCRDQSDCFKDTFTLIIILSKDGVDYAM